MTQPIPPTNYAGTVYGTPQQPEWPPMPEKKPQTPVKTHVLWGAATLLALTAGLGIGGANTEATSASGEPVVETVNVTPDACLEALDYAEEVIDYAADGMSAAADVMLAASQLDVAGIEEATARIREAGDAAERIGPAYRAARDECRSAAE